MQVDSYRFILLVLNILLPLTIAFYLYYTRKYRNFDEILYAIIALILWSIRYIWILIVSFEVQNDILNRLVALDLALLLIVVSVWIKNAFFLPRDTVWGKINAFLIWSTIMILTGVIVPLTLFLPSRLHATPAVNDINVILSIANTIFIITLVIQALFRILPSFVQKKTVFHWYQAGLFAGFFLISFGDLLFYWIFISAPLQLLAPILGSIIILVTLIGFRILPFFQFATLVDSGILIVNIKDERLEYLNLTARQFLTDDLRRKSNLKFKEVWPSHTELYQTYQRVKTETRATQIEERVFNYWIRKYQNIQFTFYLLGEETQFPLRIGILMLDSDEIQFLKQRKDFLLDILTHDIANVSQTLSFALDSIKNEDFVSLETWDIIKMAQDQNSRLKNLVSGAHTLLSIDNITQYTKVDREFGTFLSTLFEKEQEEYPDFDIEVADFSSIKDVKTDGTLETALELVIESIIEVCSSDCKSVKTVIDTDVSKKFHRINFQFRSEGIKLNLMENYSQIDKSELVATATSPARINLIVANAILQKNGGEISIDSNPLEKLNQTISVAFPYFEDVE